MVLQAFHKEEHLQMSLDTILSSLLVIIIIIIKIIFIGDNTLHYSTNFTRRGKACLGSRPVDYHTKSEVRVKCFLTRSMVFK